MMIFGEVRPGTPRWFVAVVLPIIEALGSYGRTHKNPCAIAGWDLHSASGVIHWVLMGLSDYRLRIEQERTRSKHTNSTDHSQQVLLHCNSPREAFSETVSVGPSAHFDLRGQNPATPMGLRVSTPEL